GTLAVNNTISAGAISDSEATIFNGTGGSQTVTATGDQNYTGDVTLGANTTLNSTTLELAKVLGGGKDLTLNNSLTAALNGVLSVVVTVALTGSGTLAVNNTISAGAITDSEATTFNGAGGSQTVTTTVDQNYTGDVTLGANT